VALVPETPLEEAQDMLARAKAIGARVREKEQVILDMSTEELEELRTDLSDSVAAASAAIAQIKTLLAARDSE
jgi:tryptophan 2,3-dioxygenase